MNRKRRQQLREIEETLPLKPDYNHQFTQGELNEFDFRGWDIRRLPYGVQKAARGGTVAGHVIDGQVECVNCNRTVWSVNPDLENLCEECDYYARVELWDDRAAYAKRNNMKPVNPFADSDSSDILINPFKDED